MPDGWRRELRTDPRHRGAAGLGGWVAIAWQDRIADGAARQAAAVAAAAQRIRHLTLGLRAAGSLWQRRVPADALARLATLAPLLGTDAGRWRRQRAGSRRRPHARAGPAPSSAAPPGGCYAAAAPLARAAAHGATSLADLIVAANTCPSPQKLPDDEARILDMLADPAALEDFTGALRQQANEILTEFYDDADTAGPLAQSLIEDPGAATDLLERRT